CAIGDNMHLRTARSLSGGAFRHTSQTTGLESVECRPLRGHSHAPPSAKGHPIFIPRAANLLSSLLTLLPCCAFAQSSVVMYGYLDLGLVKRSGDSPGIERGYNNWLGFHGKEALGNGLHAIFRLETRFNPDTGETERPRTFWQGESTVGLHSDRYGTLRLGRALTPLWDAAWQYEPWVNSGFNASLAAYQTGSYGSDGIHDVALGY